MDESLTPDEVAVLYGRYGAFVHRRCPLLLRDVQLADDALQETFVRAMQRGRLLRTMELPLRWLHPVADRCCFDQLRRGRRLRAASSLDDLNLGGAHPARKRSSAPAGSGRRAVPWASTRPLFSAAPATTARLSSSVSPCPSAFGSRSDEASSSWGKGSSQ